MNGPMAEDLDEVFRMAAFFAEVGFRDLCKDATQQRFEIARRLNREGITERVLRLLRAYADKCGRAPDRLFCSWMLKPAVALQKVDEMRQHSAWLTRIATRLAAEEKAREAPAPIFDLKSRRAQG